MSSMNEALNKERLRAVNELRTLAETAAEEKRQFTAEEQQSYDRMSAHIDELDARNKELLEHEERANADAEAWAQIEAAKRQPEKDSRGISADEEFRQFAMGKSGKVFNLAADTDVFNRALVKGTPAAGGDTVPTSFYGQLVEYMTERSAVMRSGATILNTSSGEALEIPKVTQHGGPADIIPEGAQITEDDPTFAKIDLGAYKYGRLFYVSPELLNDSGVAILPYLAKQAGWSLGDALGRDLVIGDGTNKPRGIMADTVPGVTGPAGGGFGSQEVVGEGGDLLIDLFHSVIEPYRVSPSCKWMMNDNTVAQVRKLKNSNGDYLWQPGLIAGAPDTILGKPVLIDLNVPDVAAGSDSIIFGDFSVYFIRMVGGVRFERSDEFKFDSDMISFRTLMRADGAMVDVTGALKTFRGGA